MRKMESSSEASDKVPLVVHRQPSSNSSAWSKGTRTISELGDSDFSMASGILNHTSGRLETRGPDDWQDVELSNLRQGQGGEHEQRDETEQEGRSGYDWAWLCTPRTPWSKPSAPPKFFPVVGQMPWTIALIMGFQHALAMIGGIVTAPLLVSGPFDLRLNKEEREYLIAAGLMVSGITSVLQIYQVDLPRTSGLKLGTGLISVLGTSFTFIPIARATASFIMAEDSSSFCSADVECLNAWGGQDTMYQGISIPGTTNNGQCNLETNRCRMSGQEAYGAILGTCAVCGILQILLSLTPRHILKKLFPSTVCGVCVILIGIGLTGTGMRYWGGGVFCADHMHKRKVVFRGEDLAGDWTMTYPSESPCANRACEAPDGKFVGVCRYTGPRYESVLNITRGDVTECEAFADEPSVSPPVWDPSASWVTCSGNGDVALPFGSPQYILLGLSVFGVLLLIEMFGSPFLRNGEVVVALGFGYLLASLSSYTDSENRMNKYIDDTRIEQAPDMIILWGKTFPLGFYAPAVFPILLCYVVSSVETVGDITASSEASHVSISGEEFDHRIQGGLLANGVASIMACLATSLPNTTLSQNNGVIALTRCANKRAGYCACMWLTTFGLFAKLSAIVASIPDCVLGGMTTFLFANIILSGVRVMGKEKMARRDRFVCAAALGVGVGVAIVPGWASNALWMSSGDESGAAALARKTIVIMLSTPYCIGTLLAITLNLIIPLDLEEGLDDMSGRPC